jgi:hypothetical protein
MFNMIKDLKGGLTAAGRKYFKRKDGSNLKPGVQGKADTPEKIKRKGSFLRRHFANLQGPLVDKNGEPTRLALSVHAWGEAVPKTRAAAKKLAAKGQKLLEKYRQKVKMHEKKSLLKKKQVKKVLHLPHQNTQTPPFGST